MHKVSAAYEKTNTTRDLPINIYQFRFNEEQNRIRQRHWHRSLEIMYHENADGSVFLDGKEYPIKGDCLVLINSRCVHEIHNHVTDQSSTTVLLVPYALLKQEIPSWDNICFSADTDDETIIRIIKEMYNASLEQSPFQHLKIHSLLYELLFYLCSRCLKNRDNQQISLLCSTEEWARNVVQYLNDHYASELSAADVSAYFMYSREAFSRKFHQVFSCTFHQFLTKLRLQSAMKQIRTSDARFSEIASECGFSELRTMNRNLRNYTGLTPEEIRRLPEEEYLRLQSKLS